MTCGGSLGLFLALLVGVSGCGSGPKEAANSVSGKVTLNGSAVSGTVSFVGPDNKESMPAPIKPDGTYTVADPPQGKCKILVKGMGGTATGVGSAPVKDSPAMTGQSVAPPAKYASITTTDLTFDVQSGKQKYDIELKP